jgi:hypothetical protein
VRVDIELAANDYATALEIGPCTRRITGLKTRGEKNS